MRRGIAAVTIPRRTTRRRNGTQPQHHYLHLQSKQPPRALDPVVAACCLFRHAPAMGKKPGLRNPEPRGQPGCASIEDLGRPSRLDNMAVLRQKEAERR